MLKITSRLRRLALPKYIIPLRQFSLKAEVLGAMPPRRYKIKSFDQIKLGDIMSSPYDFKLYRIFGKHNEEILHGNKDGSMKLEMEWIEGEEVKEPIKPNTKITGIISGTTKLINRQGTKFNNNTMLHTLSFLVTDQKNKLIHCNKDKLR